MSILQEKIKELQSSLKNYSENLAKRNQLVDIPWTMVDGDLNLQRLIFRKDNSLYIVKEGEINESKWEYLSGLDSLVIELEGKKILMNEIYSDTKALILKKDGSNVHFLAFANQNELPDLNLLNHLQTLKIDTTSQVEQKKQIEENTTVIFIWISVIILTAILSIVLLSN